MALAVVNGAMIRCSMGTLPIPLVIIPKNQAFISSQPIATVNDTTPANIATFGMCMVTGQPKPCTPAIAGPWSPGCQKVTSQAAVLTDDSKASCGSGGVITILNPGQMSVQLG